MHLIQYQIWKDGNGNTRKLIFYCECVVDKNTHWTADEKALPNFLTVQWNCVVRIRKGSVHGLNRNRLVPSHNKAWTSTGVWYCSNNPDSKVHGANMVPTWVLSAPDGPHVGPMNLTIKEWAGDMIKKWPGYYRSISFTKGINVELWCWWSFVLSQCFQILLNSLRETHECILVSGNNKHTGKTNNKTPI